MADNLTVDECFQTDNQIELNRLIEAGATINYAQQCMLISRNWFSTVSLLRQRGFQFDLRAMLFNINSLEMVDLLMEFGFDINTKFRNTCSLLANVHSLQGDRLEIFLKGLIGRGFNMYTCTHNYDFAPGNYIPELYEAIAIAIRYDQIDLLCFCDQFDPKMITESDSHILFACVFFNAIKCAEYLLHRDIDRTLRNDEGMLAYEIHHYDNNGDRESIKTLIRDFDPSSFIKEPMGL